MLIYLIVNRLNGKLYVGKTTLSLAARRWSHIAHANHNYNKKQVISKAIAKHGIDNFDFHVLRDDIRRKMAVSL